jgi:hypothetical protein
VTRCRTYPCTRSAPQFNVAEGSTTPPSGVGAFFSLCYLGRNLGPQRKWVLLGVGRLGPARLNQYSAGFKNKRSSEKTRGFVASNSRLLYSARDHGKDEHLPPGRPPQHTASEFSGRAAKLVLATNRLLTRLVSLAASARSAWSSACALCPVEKLQQGHVLQLAAPSPQWAKALQA